jgi:hypothetical protein
MNELLANVRQFKSEGFFVLRSPLLPFDDLMKWGDGLLTGGSQDGRDYELKCETSRARIARILERPDVCEAIFLASPSLAEASLAWWSDPKSQTGRKAEKALVKYVLRMAGRSTPFGLFAGISVGLCGSQSKLVLKETASYRRHTRLDIDYLITLAHAIANSRTLGSAVEYQPNPALYRVGQRLRYPEARFDEAERNYYLASVDANHFILSALTLSDRGMRISDLARGLTELYPEVGIAEAKEFVCTLIKNQILLPRVIPPLTGSDPVEDIIAQLEAAPLAEARDAATCLRHVQTQLAEIDRDGLGISSERYDEVKRTLGQLPGALDSSSLFRVDLAKPIKHALLGSDVLDEALRGVELLRCTAPPRTERALERFRDAFLERYELREVPLAEALDEESGIGLGDSREDDIKTSPILNGLPFPSVENEPDVWGERDSILLRKLEQTIQNDSMEMTLDER